MVGVFIRGQYGFHLVTGPSGMHFSMPQSFSCKKKILFFSFYNLAKRSYLQLTFKCSDMSLLVFRDRETDCCMTRQDTAGYQRTYMTLLVLVYTEIIANSKTTICIDIKLISCMVCIFA